MGVYIKGMEMPKNCWECPCDYGSFGECVCGLTEKTTRKFREKRRDDCPLVEVPNHSRLIDVNELLEHAWRDKLDSRELIAKMIDGAPTVIPASEVGE